MAIREFTDSAGVVWRVWDVTIDQLHPATRGEDFMGDLQDGWLAFESATEKRRIAAPYPSDWTEFSIPQLEALCRSAPLLPSRRPTTPTGVHRAFVVADAERTAATKAATPVERSFTSPRGREWTMREHERARPDGAREVVLRFSSGDTVVDLPDAPADWRTATLHQCAFMLLDAVPPRRPDQGTGPQRRREDRPVEDRSRSQARRDTPADQHPR